MKRFLSVEELIVGKVLFCLTLVGLIGCKNERPNPPVESQVISNVTLPDDPMQLSMLPGVWVRVQDRELETMTIEQNGAIRSSICGEMKVIKREDFALVLNRNMDIPGAALGSIEESTLTISVVSSTKKKDCLPEGDTVKCQVKHSHSNLELTCKGEKLIYTNPGIVDKQLEKISLREKKKLSYFSNSQDFQVRVGGIFDYEKCGPAKIVYMEPENCYGKNKFCGKISLHFENEFKSKICMVSDQICTYAVPFSSSHYGTPLNEPFTIQCGDNNTGSDFIYISPNPS